MIRKLKWSASAADDDSNALMPILSLMLILIPVLLGNIAFSHLRVQHASLPPVEPTRGTTNTSSLPVLFLELKSDSTTLRVVNESTGADLAAPFSLLSSSDSELQRLLTDFSESKLLIIRSAGTLAYGTALQAIDRFQNIRRVSKLPELEIVIVPEKLK